MDYSFNNIIRSAGGLTIRREGGKIFIALLYKNGQWILPKGRIKKDEHVKDAALREVYEETSIIPKKMKILKKMGCVYYIAHQPCDCYLPRFKIVTYFLIETVQKKVRPLKKEGFQKVHWCLLEDAFRKVSFSNNKLLLLKSLKYFEKDILPNSKVDTIAVGVGGSGSRMTKDGRPYPKLTLPLINGLPILKILLDNIIKQGFEKIYLLASYFYKETMSFVAKHYPKSQNIEIIDGGEDGRQGGVPTVLQKIIPKLKKPFIYTDGNIIYNPSLLRALSSSASDSLVKMALSPKDRARTHLKIYLKDKEVNKIFLQQPFLDQQECENGEVLCSLGVMLLDPRVFNLSLEINRFNDLDLALQFLIKTKFNTDINLVDFLKYDREWYSLHTKDDLKIINKKGKNFLRSLTKK